MMWRVALHATQGKERMNKKDIIRMAREAGIRIAGPMDSIDPKNVYIHELERFANLVAADEREECAKVCEAEADKWEGDDGPICAEARMCAANIRARWQHG